MEAVIVEATDTTTADNRQIDCIGIWHMPNPRVRSRQVEDHYCSTDTREAVENMT